MMRKKLKSGENKRKKDRERLIFILGLLFSLSFFLLQFAARRLEGFGEWYAVTVYPVLENSVGRIFGWFPFSAAELLLYGSFFLFLFYGVLHLRQWKKIANRTFLLISALLLVYTTNCGINYYRRPFSQTLPYRLRTYTSDELEELVMMLTERVNLTQAERGHVREERSGANEELFLKSDVTEESVKAMERLGEEYPQLAGFYPKPKKLIFSEVLSCQQLAGVYSPFTIEANYNGDMTSYNIPHTACHELSHLKGFMREDEANFIGFLACVGSEDPELRYSGYLSGWIYAGNALASDNREKYSYYWNELNEETKADLLENNEFWSRFDTRTAQISEVLNDTYLKANSQSDGVKSYGRVVDLLLAWYHR